MVEDTLELLTKLVGHTQLVENASVSLAITAAPHFKTLNSSIGDIGKTLSTLGNKYSDLLNGASLTDLTSGAENIELTYKNLGIQADFTSAQIETLKDQIIEINELSGKKISGSQLLNAAVVASSGRTTNKSMHETSDTAANGNIEESTQKTDKATETLTALKAVISEFKNDSPANPFNAISSALDGLSPKQLELVTDALNYLGPETLDAITGGAEAAAEAISGLKAGVEIFNSLKEARDAYKKGGLVGLASSVFDLVDKDEASTVKPMETNANKTKGKGPSFSELQSKNASNKSITPTNNNNASKIAARTKMSKSGIFSTASSNALNGIKSLISKFDVGVGPLKSLAAKTSSAFSFIGDIVNKAKNIGSAALGKGASVFQGVKGTFKKIPGLKQLINVESITSTLLNSNLTTAEKMRAIGRDIGSIGGSIVGGAIGGTVGTAIAPGVGTALLGLLGQQAGSEVGEVFGETVANLLAKILGVNEEQAKRSTDTHVTLVSPITGERTTKTISGTDIYAGPIVMEGV